MDTMFARVKAESMGEALARLKELYPTEAAGVRRLSFPSDPNRLFAAPPAGTGVVESIEKLDEWVVSTVSREEREYEVRGFREWRVVFDDGHSSGWASLSSARGSAKQALRDWLCRVRSTCPVRIESGDEYRDVACEYVRTDRIVLGTEPASAKGTRVARTLRYGISWVPGKGGDESC